MKKLIKHSKHQPGLIYVGQGMNAIWLTPEDIQKINDLAWENVEKDRLARHAEHGNRIDVA